MRTIAEFVLRIWPLNRILFAVWRYFPFPRGSRSRIIRSANDTFLVGVMAMICDDDGHLLLVRSTYDPRYEWSLPGGWMGRNEQPRECIKRELREETGYEIAIDCLLDTQTRRHLPSVDIVFRGRVVSGEFRPSAEVTEVRFFRTDDLPDSLPPSHRKLIGRHAVTIEAT
jgi:8-oxo-dGTP diphosphatase